MTLAFLVCISAGFIVATELLARRLALRADITRRVVHIGTSLVAAAAPLYVSSWEIAIVSLLFAAALWFARHHSLLSSIHAVSRQTYGDIYLPLGVALSALVILPDLDAYRFGILIMGLSDPLAGLVGERMGTHPIRPYYALKSAEGTLAFFLSAMVLTVIHVPEIGLSIIIIPFILAALELILTRGLDNLFLPIVASGLLLSI